MLRDVCLALKVYLARVPFENVQQTAAEESWRKAQAWLQSVQPLLPEGNDSFVVQELPPFPLSSQELRVLQTTIDRLAQSRPEAPPMREGVLSSPAPRRVRNVMLSAYGLGFLLLASYTTTVVAATFFRDANSRLYVSLNLGISVVAILIWVLHVRRLGDHHSKTKKFRSLRQ